MSKQIINQQQGQLPAQEHGSNQIIYMDDSMKSMLANLPKETQDALAELVARKMINLQSDIERAKVRQYLAAQDSINFIHDAEQLARIQRREGKLPQFQSTHIQAHINTATGSMDMESRSNSCYVATATYQNAYHPNVVILRDFRDRYLCTQGWGKLFIHLYYTIGPYLAVLPQHSRVMRHLSQKVLDWIVWHIVTTHYI